MRSISEGIALCWLGNLGWLLYAEGRFIAFDLDLDLDLRLQPSPIPTEEIAKVLDVNFITHWHGDHFNLDTCRVLAEQSACLFVIPANCRERASSLSLEEARLHIARPGEAFDLPGIQVLPHKALHGDKNFTVYHLANFEDCGYIFTFGGKKFFQPGDTVLLEEHLSLAGIDALFVSPTVHNTYVDRSTILINALEPAYIFPQHFGTYAEAEDNLYWTKGYPDELKAALPKPMRERYHKLVQGEVFVVT